MIFEQLIVYTVLLLAAYPVLFSIDKVTTPGTGGMKSTILVQRLLNGKVPTKAYKGDAGFDLYATSNFTLYPGKLISHPLHVKLQLPINTWAGIYGRSSLIKKGIIIQTGVIDEGYRGPIEVSLFLPFQNHCTITWGFGMGGPCDYQIKEGDRIAQLILHPHRSDYQIKEVDKIDENTERGNKGFGSSGR